MNEPKILVGCPVYEGTKYCIDRFIDSLNKLSYKNKEILLVDNSDADEFFNELKSKGINIIKDSNKDLFKMARVVSSRNLIISYAIENNFDYLMMMDADVILPENAIEELLSSNKDIVSGLYHNYSSINGKLRPLPVALKLLTEEEFAEAKSKYSLPDYVQTRFHMPRHLAPEEVASDALQEVFICCGGCMLASRDAFSKIKYSCQEENGKIKVADDISFLRDARNLGFQIFCNTKVKCDHLLAGKYNVDSDGNFIHPWAT